MDINALDLNLLKVFNAVMTERNVSRAANKLFMSQPAVSHALSRLRHSLKDELFIKAPGGVAPTPRAVELGEPIHSTLVALEEALNPQEFDPLTSRHVFRIATHDYFTSVIAAELANWVKERAPNISIRLKPTEGRAMEMLDNQEADVAVSAFGELPDRMVALDLFEDEYVCVIGKHHPLAKGKLTLKRFANASHLLISPRGDERGFVDTALAKQGLTRQVSMIVNQFASAAEIVANSNLVLTAPQRIAQQAVDRYGCVIEPCPIDAPETFTSTSVVRHRILGNHPPIHWLCETLRQVCAH